MISIVCPAYNESGAVGKTIDGIHTAMASTGLKYELIVVDDGSTDNTATEASRAKAVVISHPRNAGYGAALKTGILKAQYDWIAIIDSDGTYPVDELPQLLSYIPHFDMVVGARTGKFYWNSTIKTAARWFFLWLSEFVTGKHIPDINSGFRVFRKQIALQHLARIGNYTLITQPHSPDDVSGNMPYNRQKLVHWVTVPYLPLVSRSKISEK